MQLKRRVDPSSAVALHTRPVEVSQASFAAHTLKLVLHMTFLNCQVQKSKFKFELSIAYINKYLYKDWRKETRVIKKSTCFHPHHGLYKYGGAFRWFFHATTPLFPLEARFALPALVGNKVLLRSDDSPALLASVHNLRFRGCFRNNRVSVTSCSHLQFSLFDDVSPPTLNALQ